jgi:hypothetical protein
MRALDSMKVDYYVVIERDQYTMYNKHIPRSKLLILDPTYQENYDTCDDLGLTKSVGPGAARNFAWDHAISMGADFHWVMDDNLEDFYRYDKDTRVRCRSAGLLRSCEVFADRYENVAISGLQYRFFCIPGQYRPPFVMNTRIYSCLLIKNSIPYRWRGRYNEDTDIALRVLKDGWCTVQFNHALQGKIVTQAIGGGNSEAFYDKEGTKPKSDMLEMLHPDVSKTVWKYGRWHHEVNYRPFRYNALKRKEGTWMPPGNDDFGMDLIELDQETHKAELLEKGGAIKLLEQSGVVEA